MYAIRADRESSIGMRVDKELGMTGNGTEISEYESSQVFDFELGEFLIAQLNEIHAPAGEQSTAFEQARLPYDPMRELLWG